MKKRKAYYGVLTLLLLLTGCGETSSDLSSVPDSTPEESSTPSKGKFDVELPTEIPLYGEDSVQIHYKRTDGKYSPWSLWLWKDGGDGAQHMFNYMDDEYVIASYKLSDFNINLEEEASARLGFIVAKNPGSTWDAKDTDGDRFIEFADLEKDSDGVFHVYVYQNDANVYIDSSKKMLDKINYLRFNNESTIECSANNALSEYEIFENGVSIAKNSVPGVSKFTYKFTEEHPFSYTNAYTAKVTFKQSKSIQEGTVSLQRLFATSSFNDAFYYDGQLGAIYSNSATTFKVWSPVSSKITLNVYENGTPEYIDSSLGSDSVYKQVEMTKGEKGVFEATIEEDLDGKYYTYTVYNGTFPSGREVVDPYAKSTGVNGLRGMVVNFDKTNPTGWDEISAHQYDRKQLTVWETHVADVTSSSTWTGNEENRKRYLGMVEEGTTYTENGVTVSTGFDHIKELGVNAVQLIPIFDQANDEINPSFNWGYNPLNYNSLEGVYSSNPYDGYTKIKEFKQVVKAFNEAGINIIMDVVYNHTNSVNGTNFDVLMPGYYYRYDGNGKAFNGSGCGNETASENLMMRKFMIDSAVFWADEYKLGGYRFDLMGLHDIETMNLLTAEVSKINPSITIYGEPWTGGTSGLSYGKQAVQNNANSFVGFGQFNDRIRDELIKGGLSGASEKSWISNTNANTTIMENLISGIKGITKNAAFEMADPDKTVTYVTCHDNYTLYDRFKAAGITDETMVKQMAMLANSVVFTSQGTSFMLAGEEFLRTKQGNNNSYNSTYEVNELDYSLKVKHLDMFTNYQKLIELKQTVDGLHLGKDENKALLVEARESGNVIKYTITDKTNGKEYVVIHSNGVNVDGRASYDLTGYTLYLDTLNELSGELTSVTPKAFQTIIAYK